MKMKSRFSRRLFAMAYVFIFLAGSITSAQAASSGPVAMSFMFRSIEYEHRWSKDNQNEFTPNGDTDLTSWKDMITLNVYESVSTGEQLADAANKVLVNYQRNGQILRTDSKPRTADGPAEHLVVAVLGSSTFLEAAFARFVFVDGVGTVVVYSHRVYGKPAGPAMSDWLEANGLQVEKALMAWKPVPGPNALKGLPQSR